MPIKGKLRSEAGESSSEPCQIKNSCRHCMLPSLRVTTNGLPWSRTLPNFGSERRDGWDATAAQFPDQTRYQSPARRLSG